MIQISAKLTQCLKRRTPRQRPSSPPPLIWSRISKLLKVFYIAHHKSPPFSAQPRFKGTWCSWLSRSLSISSEKLARGVRFNPGRVHFFSLRLPSISITISALIYPVRLNYGCCVQVLSRVEFCAKTRRNPCVAGNGPGAAVRSPSCHRHPPCLLAAKTVISKRGFTELNEIEPVTHVVRGKASTNTLIKRLPANFIRNDGLQPDVSLLSFSDFRISRLRNPFG